MLKGPRSARGDLGDQGDQGDQGYLGDQGALIAVLNLKGGVGKTTLATNLAAAAHLSGQRTTLLDLDAQGSASSWYSRRRDGSRLAGLAVPKADKPLSRSKYLELAGGAAVVVFDGPARLGDVTRAAAVAADVVVIPLRPGYYDLEATTKTLEYLDSADQIRSLAGRAEVARVFVLNGAVVGTRAIEHAADALDAAERRACPIVIHNRAAFWESAPLGESVLTMFPGTRAAREIEALYRYIIRTIAPARSQEGAGGPL